MADLKVTYDDFTLESKWSCRCVYTYNSSGSFLDSTCTQSGLTTAKETVRFPVSLPAGAKVIGAKVHAAHTPGLYGGTFTINDNEPDDDGIVTLDAPDFSAGYVDVMFAWTGYTDGSSAHRDEYPTHNGSDSQVSTFGHTSTSKVSDIYLLIEYQQNGIIYHAEGGKLVPYQLYRAENGALVPYQIKHAEAGELVPYG